MKQFRFIILYLVVSALASLQVPAESSKVEAHRLDNNLYLVKGTTGGNIAFLVTEEGVLVIDSGYFPSDGQAVTEVVRKITDKSIKYVVFTHMHSDHTNGIAGFPDNVRIIGHKNITDNIRRFNEKKTIEQINKMEEKLTLLKKKTHTPDIEKQVSDIKATLNQLKSIKFRTPDIVFEKEKTLTMGNETILLKYMGKAHTNDNIVVIFKNHNTIHTGDLIFNGIFPYLIPEHGADSDGWINALETLESMNFNTVIPGHGEITDNSVFKKQALYFSQIKKQVSKMIAMKKPLDDILNSVKVDGMESMQGSQFKPNVEAVYNELIK